MPAGLGVELVLAFALVALLVIAFFVGRRLRAAPLPEPRRPARRDGLGARLRAVVAKGRPTDEDWAELEEALVRADAGRAAAREIVTRVRERHEPGLDPEVLLIEEIAGMFADDPVWRLPSRRLAIVLVVGINGTGKTTSIGKLARLLKERGSSVAVANSDTFRAAAGEQLGVWAERAGATMVRQGPGADPGVVAFDAYQHARARGVDVLIVDTAGRLHTKTPLMDELAKVRRVIERQGQVHESLLVIDATAGQNGLVQARQFADAVGLTGVVLTKLDGTAKGGIAVAIEQTLGIPIKLVGLGEDIDDLEPFDPKTFVDALLA